MSGLFGERVDIKKRWWALREVGGTADVGGARRLSGFLFTSGAKKESMTVRRELSFSPRQLHPQQAQQQAQRHLLRWMPVWCPLGYPPVVPLAVPAFSGRSPAGAEEPRPSRLGTPNKANQNLLPAAGQWCPRRLSPALPFGAGLADLPG